MIKFSSSSFVRSNLVVGTSVRSITSATTSYPVRAALWKSNRADQTSDRRFAARRPFTQVVKTSLDEVPFSIPSLNSEPKVFITPGLTPKAPSPRVLSAINNHVQHLLDAQSTADHTQPRPYSLESFHVMDLNSVKAKYDQWVSKMPSIRPFYAVKSNPNPDLLACLNKLGTGFDCASKSEMETVIALGAKPENIIFAHPCKSPADILAAKAMGVKRTTFDSETELVKIKELYPEMELVMRIWVDDSKAQCQLSNKYGSRRDEWHGLLSLAKVLNLKVVGVSFHVGSGGSKDSYSSALTDARHIFDVAEEYGHRMTLLDVGGGFPGIETSANEFEQCAKIINPLLSLFPSHVNVIAEPGRYFCAESQTLVSMVIAKRMREDRPAYFIGDGVYQSFNCIMYDHTKLRKSETSNDESLFPSVVFGQTCDGIDQIASDMMLPYLDVGDWVAFPGMGAYTTAASSRFNGFGMPGVIVVDE